MVIFFFLGVQFPLFYIQSLFFFNYDFCWDFFYYHCRSLAACETMHGAWTTTNFAPSHFQKKKKLEKKEQMDWNWPIIDLPTSVKVTLIQLRFICFCFGCFFSLFYNGLSGRSTNSTSSSTTSAENCKRHFHVFQYDWLVFFLIFFFWNYLFHSLHWYLISLMWLKMPVIVTVL